LSPYFDNAATSHPKPEQVYQASSEALRLGGSPGRGAHRIALDAGRLVFQSRESIASFLGMADSSRLILAPGCTAAINIVLNGLLKANRIKTGDTVLVSAFEHNAVMRPLAAMAELLNLNIVVVPPARAAEPDRCFKSLIDAQALSRLLDQHKPSLCAFTRASNVTGQILDLEMISSILAGRDIPLLLDAAQSAGHVKENLSAQANVSFWLSSGHKGLLGPSGIGLLYIKPSEELGLSVLGGTGSNSDSWQMPSEFPDRFEPGTAAPHLVAGLAAGVAFVVSQGEALRQNEQSLSLKFLQGLASLNKRKLERAIELVGRPLWDFNVPERDQSENLKNFLPVFSLSFARLGMTPDQVAQQLDLAFDIATRPGLHCALLAHQTLASTEQGLLRVSFGAFNTAGEVDQLLDALARI